MRKQAAPRHKASFDFPLRAVELNLLRAHGSRSSVIREFFTYYVVSGSDRFICRSLVESIGIEPNRVIGMDVRLVSTSQGTEAGVDYTMSQKEDLIRTDELIIKNLKTNKVLQISQEIGKVPVLSFGNSSGDCAMLLRRWCRESRFLILNLLRGVI